MYESRYDRCEQIFVLKKKIGTDDEKKMHPGTGGGKTFFRLAGTICNF